MVGVSPAIVGGGRWHGCMDRCGAGGGEDGDSEVHGVGGWGGKFLFDCIEVWKYQ